MRLRPALLTLIVCCVGLASGAGLAQAGGGQTIAGAPVAVLGQAPAQADIGRCWTYYNPKVFRFRVPICRASLPFAGVTNEAAQSPQIYLVSLKKGQRIHATITLIDQPASGYEAGSFELAGPATLRWRSYNPGTNVWTQVNGLPRADNGIDLNRERSMRLALSGAPPVGWTDQWPEMPTKLSGTAVVPRTGQYELSPSGGDWVSTPGHEPSDKHHARVRIAITSR